MKSFPRIVSLPLALAVLAFALTSTQVFGNLVLNGGFEAGNLSSWVLVDTSNTPGLTTVPFDAASAHTGSYHLKAGPNWANQQNPTVATLTQNLTTVIGQTYQLDFFLRNEIFITPTPGTVSFQWSWAGVSIGSVSLADAAVAFAYTGFSASGLVATSTSTELKFSFRHDPGFWHLDDVSVVAAPVGVPDTGVTLILMGLAFACLAIFRRRFV